ncbi:MAG: branched-chain amino acid ABC transporter permease, partial [Candidatus Hodarchaeota archaeon]
SIDLEIELRIWRLTDPVREFVIVLIIMIVSIVILLAIYNSKLGTIFKGIRDDDYATEASGINITKYKLISFMISSFFAGLAGVLYTLHLGNVNFELFSNRLSFFPVIFTLLGGIATISGAVLGAFTFVLLTRVINEVITFLFPNLPTALTTQIETISVFIFAMILLIIIRVTDRGIMEPLIRHSKSLWDILRGK